ncbi:MAG: DUF3365 domain-containing protein [Bacteroidia bacterium]|nr:DUF3365 domain-containing protein [Bacteroidia bacterium]
MKFDLTKLALLLTLLLINGLAQSCGGKSTEKEPGALAQPDPDHLSQEDLAWMQKGLDIIGPSQQVLGGKLKAALEAGGVQHAVQYCNIAAFPLMDSLSQTYQVKIRRTSLKARNPKDAPDAAEREMLESFTARYHAGESLDPVIRNLEGGKKGFYAPILVQEMCLKCHGIKGTDIADADYAIISDLYPKDLATEYKSGDLRGIWSLTFTP